MALQALLVDTRNGMGETAAVAVLNVMMFTLHWNADS
jgi:hypothetical protein